MSKWRWLTPVFFLGVGGSPATISSAADTPANPTDFQGVWKMDGYALIMDVGAKEVVYYDVTEISCIESDRTPIAKLAERFRGGLVQRSRESAVLRDHEQPYSISRIAHLPDRCLNGGTKGSDPLLNFEVFWRYLEENYANFGPRNVAWDAIFAEFRPKITSKSSQDDLWAAYKAILPRLDDVHVFITNGKQGPDKRSVNAGRPSGLREALLIQDPSLDENESYQRDDAVAEALNRLVLHDVLKGRYLTELRSAYQWGWVTPTVGYINIKRMRALFDKPATDPQVVERAVNAAGDRIMTDLEKAEAIIIDVRQNHGGANIVGKAIAAHFMSHPVTIRKRAKTPTGYTAWFDVVLEPRGKQFKKPVYVLVSENTVSAAEWFTLYMKDLPNVTVIGEPTRGTMSDILLKLMPDGSYLGIANIQTADSAGRSFEGAGITPEIPLQNYDPARLVVGYRDAIDLALRLQTEKHGHS